MPEQYDEEYTHIRVGEDLRKYLDLCRFVLEAIQCELLLGKLDKEQDDSDKRKQDKKNKPQCEQPRISQGGRVRHQCLRDGSGIFVVQGANLSKLANQEHRDDGRTQVDRHMQEDRVPNVSRADINKRPEPATNGCKEELLKVSVEQTKGQSRKEDCHKLTMLNQTINQELTEDHLLKNGCQDSDGKNAKKRF